jgi:hypothetical protein
MEQLQSFRTELVEWLKEIVPFSKLDLYIRKTREGLIQESARHDYVNYIFCTDKHRYGVYATPWYLGCAASPILAGAIDDLPDGPFRYETWLHIKDAIFRYEMVKLVPVAESSSVGLPDASKVPDPTPEGKEYFEANGELWRAKERFERAERAYNGQTRRDAETPLSIGEAREHHPSEKVG